MGKLRIQALTATPRKTLIVGDIHGCADEFRELIDRFRPTSRDTIIAVGDLINRGPDSTQVLQIAREHGVLPVLGNHEQRFLKAKKGKAAKHLKETDWDCYRRLKPEDWEWIAQWPHIIHLPQMESVVVHGGFAPFVEWPNQSPEVVTQIQVLNRKLMPSKRAQAPTGRPWADLWQSEPHVYYGHTPRPNVLMHPYATGLDTGCVYGGHLSAIELPARKLIQIKAHSTYLKSSAVSQL